MSGRRFWTRILVEIEVDAENEEAARKRVDDFLIMDAAKSDDLDLWMNIVEFEDTQERPDDTDEQNGC